MSLDEAALYNDVDKVSLQRLRSKDKKNGRNDRFVNGKVLINYKKPCEFEISKLYYKALFICNGHESELADELAKIMGLNKKSVYMYLYRFNFKHYKKALKLKEALERVCKNSLWGDIEL